MPSAQVQSVGEKLLSMPLGQSVRDFLNYLTVEAGLSNNTILAYGRDLKGFIQYCDCERVGQLGQIKPALIQNYLQTLTKSQRSESSIKRGLVAIRMFLRFAKLMGLVDNDLTATLEGPKLWQRLPIICSKQQVVNLLPAS
jgi:integrase/recombinase XerD